MNKYIKSIEKNKNDTSILYRLNNTRTIIIRSYIINKCKFYGNIDNNSKYSGIRFHKYIKFKNEIYE